MTPAVSDVVAKLRQELPPELVARIGPGIERMAQSVVAAEISRVLATTQSAQAER